MSGKRAGKLAVGIAAIAMMVSSVVTGTPASAQEDEPVQTSITATFWECPPGMTIDSLVASDCTLVTDGVDATISSLRDLMEPYTLADAAFDGTSFTWSPPNQIGPQITGLLWGFRESSLPGDATEYAVMGDVASYNSNGFYELATGYENPNSVIDVYNFVPAAEEQADSTLSIHQRLCGANNYDGGDPYAECHDYLLDYPAEYHVYNADDTYDETASPDLVTGNMDFVIPGTEIFITNGASAWSIQNTAQVYCTDANTGESLATDNAGMGVGSALVVDYPEGASVVCDWYIFSSDVDGVYIGEDAPETPTAEPTGTATATATPAPTGTTTVTSLPNTGSGASTQNDSSALVLAVIAVLSGGLFVGVRCTVRARRA
jgi:hypothetical protein